MRSIAFDFLGQHRHGSAFHEYLRLRKALFVDALAWDIPHNDDVEMDQYDNPCAHYALVLDQGHVIGGARAMPTNSVWGPHTYMLRDARRGGLAKIPPDVMPADVASPDVWESTRLVISDSVRDRGERASCLSMIFSELVDIVSRHGGRELVGLTRPPLVRALRQLGFPASRLGEPYRSESDGRAYAVLHMPAVPSSHLLAAE